MDIGSEELVRLRVVDCFGSLMPPCGGTGKYSRCQPLNSLILGETKKPDETQ